MMVSLIYFVKYRLFKQVILCLGMEHHLSLVVGICLANLGQFNLDYSESTQEHVEIVAVLSGLRRISPACHISLRYEPDRR